MVQYFDQLNGVIISQNSRLGTVIPVTFVPVSYYCLNVQGVLLSVPEAMEDLLAMKRLWVHEVLRVYHDRLVDDKDREWIFDLLHQVVASNLEEDLDQMFAHLVKDKPPGSRV